MPEDGPPRRYSPSPFAPSDALAQEILRTLAQDRDNLLLGDDPNPYNSLSQVISYGPQAAAPAPLSLPLRFSYTTGAFYAPSAYSAPPGAGLDPVPYYPYRDPPRPSPAADPWAPPRPRLDYAASPLRASRSAVFTCAESRVCMRCGSGMTGQRAVVVARPGLPRETVHLGCLEADDQVQPRP